MLTLFIQHTEYNHLYRQIFTACKCKLFIEWSVISLADPKLRSQMGTKSGPKAQEGAGSLWMAVTRILARSSQLIINDPRLSTPTFFSWARTHKFQRDVSSSET